MEGDDAEWVQGREGIRTKLHGIIIVTVVIMIIVIMQKIKKSREEWLALTIENDFLRGIKNKLSKSGRKTVQHSTNINHRSPQHNTHIHGTRVFLQFNPPLTQPFSSFFLSFFLFSLLFFFFVLFFPSLSRSLYLSFFTLFFSSSFFFLFFFFFFFLNVTTYYFEGTVCQAVFSQATGT